MIKKNKKLGFGTLPLTCAIAISLLSTSLSVRADNQVSLPLVTQAQGVGQGAGNFTSVLQDLQQRFPQYSSQQVILVDATTQELLLLEAGQVAGRWVISTAEAGLGSRKGSNQTPLGVHRLAQKIGDGAPLGTVFKARQNTGRVAKILTAPGARSGEDNVTTRVMWLDGLEPGLNKGGEVDSYQRYIYIHGTDEEGRLGAPASHGCIRMRNQDVADLYERVHEDTLVVIAQRK
ncbi:MAG: L,D-transpeptidase [Thiothrix sp.]|nr:MAG: L,D-transpeptidase [Thiothrix sp.]